MDLRGWDQEKKYDVPADAIFDTDLGTCDLKLGVIMRKSGLFAFLPPSLPRTELKETLSAASWEFCCLEKKR